MNKMLFIVFTAGATNAQQVNSDSEDISMSYNSPVESVVRQKDVPSVILGGFPLLFDNGSFINSLDTGLNGEDESILQNTSLGMNTMGAGAQLTGTANTRVADEFEITSGVWQIEEILLYAYQTGEIASTITGVTLQIWAGIPDEPGSTVVFGDTTTNQLSDTGFSGALRVTEETTGTIDNRQITNNLVIVNLLLPVGTYWVDYQFTGTGNSGPWVPPITINGVTTTGNSLSQNNNNSPDWIPFFDTGTAAIQGLPMLIFGTIPDLIFKNDFE